MLDKEEIQRIRAFTGKSESDKAFKTLEGILTGISLDNKIEKQEINELRQWCGAHIGLINRRPFNEAIPMIMNIIEDNEVDEDELNDLLWFSKTLAGKNIYYDVVTSDIQILHGILHGILSDNIITKAEIEELKKWMNENRHLQGTFPYDEITALVNYVLEDNKLDKSEVDLLKAFFSDFIEKEDTLINVEELKSLKSQITVSGICALNPKIEFPSKVFCFTGASERAKRSDIQVIVEKRRARFINSINKNLDYLVIGNAGNPCWAFSCYGRKVEEAIDLRKSGNKVQLVNENDFWNQIN